MTLRQEKLPQKKMELDLYFNMANDALESNDIQKALNLSNIGLEKAELENDGNWKQKFSALKSQIKGKSLKVGTTKENLISIKGIGKSGAEKLKAAGIDTIEKLANTSVTQLSSIEGIGPKIAKNYSEAAKLSLKTTNLGDFSDSKTENDEESVDTIISRFSLVKKGGPKMTTNLREPVKSIIEADGGEIDLPSEELFDKETLKTRLNEYPTSKTHKSIANTIPVEDIEFEEFEPESDFKAEEFEEAIQKQMPQIEPEIDFQEYKTSPIAVQTKTASKKDNINQEVLTNKELFEFSESVYGELDEYGFHVIKKTPNLNNIFRGIDILAVKLVQVSESQKLVYMLPLKISRVIGKLIVSMGGIDYKSNDTKITSAIRQKPQSYAKSLEKVNETILNDIICEGNLFNFLNKYLKLNLSIEKTISNRKLFFHSGPIQYKILVEPILISKNSVGFSEKIIPFAYQKGTNIHIVELKQFSALLQFLDQKCVLIEKHSENQNLIKSYEKSTDTFIRELRISSSPFAVIGIVFLLVLLFQGFFMLKIIINLAFGAVGVYVLALAYPYLKFYLKKSEIHKEFMTSNNRRTKNLDESSLTFISEELSPKLMSQFSYECVDKNENFQVIDKIEQDNTNNFLANKEIMRNVKRTDFFEKDKEEKSKNNGRSKLQSKMSQKYGNFLEGD